MTAKAPASTATVAQELVDLCRKGRNLDAVNPVSYTHLRAHET